MVNGMKSKSPVEIGQFVPIPGYPLYEIDQLGNVRRIFKSKKSLIKPAIRDGALHVRIYDSCGKRKEIKVHRLMQTTFMRAPRPGEVVYHKNQNRLDNALSNLAFIDKRELGRITGGKSRRRPVAKINRAGEVVAFYSSAREAARRNHMSYQAVMDRCNERVKNPFALDGYSYVWDDAETESELDCG